MRPEARFTAKSPRSALRHGWWALPLIVLVALLVLRPWDASTPLVFRLKPMPVASAPAAKASGPQPIDVRIIPARPASAAGGSSASR